MSSGTSKWTSTWGELDVTAAESKATYNEIRDYVWEHHQLKVSNLYIAQVKQKYGIIERENYNKAKNENAKQPKCLKEKEDAIVEASSTNNENRQDAVDTALATRYNILVIFVPTQWQGLPFHYITYTERGA
jgi:hypothetical protein